MTATVGVEDAGAVRLLTLDRPSRRNAVDTATAAALHAALQAAETDDTVRALVLTGAGDDFSAGGDASDILDVLDGDDEAVAAFLATFQQLVVDVWRSRLPVVAALSGVVYGSALNLALACDLRVCTADARLCQVFLRRGLVPDLGGAWLLPRLVGAARATELLLLAREVDGTTAAGLGLVTEIAADADTTRERALELATELAERSPGAVAATKRLVHEGLDTGLETSIAHETRAQTDAFRSPEVRLSFHSPRQGRPTPTHEE